MYAGHFAMGLARARRLRSFGANVSVACLVVLALHALNSPWLRVGR